MIKYYVFTVLVFGLAVASFLFTKVTRPFINTGGNKVSGYLGLWMIFLGGKRSFEEAQQFSDIVRKDLKKSGFLEHVLPDR